MKLAWRDDTPLSTLCKLTVSICMSARIAAAPLCSCYLMRHCNVSSFVSTTVNIMLKNFDIALHHKTTLFSSIICVCDSFCSHNSHTIHNSIYCNFGTDLYLFTKLSSYTNLIVYFGLIHSTKCNVQPLCRNFSSEILRWIEASSIFHKLVGIISFYKYTRKLHIYLL